MIIIYHCLFYILLNTACKKKEYYDTFFTSTSTKSNDANRFVNAYTIENKSFGIWRSIPQIFKGTSSEEPQIPFEFRSQEICNQRLPLVSFSKFWNPSTNTPEFLSSNKFRKELQNCLFNYKNICDPDRDSLWSRIGGEVLKTYYQSNSFEKEPLFQERAMYTFNKYI